MMSKKIKRLEEQIESFRKQVKHLLCEVRTGHKLCFVDDFYGVFNSCFKFQCLICGYETYKSAEQLTDIERRYIESLGCISLKEPTPPPCEDIDETEVKSKAKS